MSKSPLRWLWVAALVLSPLACDSKSPIEPSPPACTYTLSTTSLTAGAQGGPNTVGVTTGASCAWSATSDRGWMTITGGSTGTGNGAVSISLTPNTNVSARTGTLTVAGKAVAVLQEGAGPCTVDVSPTSASYNKDSVTGTFAVSAPAHCQWTATSSASWVAVTGGSPGTGNGSVAYSVERNRDVSPRTATITVGERTFTINQAGDPPGCDLAVSLDISPASASYDNNPAAGSIAVTAPAHCAWSAVSQAPWLTVTSGHSGTGSGTVSYAVASNGDAATRTGTIAVGSRTFTVTQLGASAQCDYSVAPVEFTACMSVPFNLTATITAQQGCTWTVAPDAAWITLTSSASGSGSGVITFRLADNWDLPRHGVVKVRWPGPTAGQNLQVAQAGCRYALSTAAFTIAAAGGTGRFDVYQVSDPISCGGALQDACLWTATSDVSWITITSSVPQRGDNPVSFTVAPNSTGAVRVGRITVRDQVVVVTQPGS